VADGMPGGSGENRFNFFGSGGKIDGSFREVSFAFWFVFFGWEVSGKFPKKRC
jgi:hypothetical protein